LRRSRNDNSRLQALAFSHDEGKVAEAFNCSAISRSHYTDKYLKPGWFTRGINSPVKSTALNQLCCAFGRQEPARAVYSERINQMKIQSRATLCEI